MDDLSSQFGKKDGKLGSTSSDDRDYGHIFDQLVNRRTRKFGLFGEAEEGDCADKHQDADLLDNLLHFVDLWSKDFGDEKYPDEVNEVDEVDT